VRFQFGIEDDERLEQRVWKVKDVADTSAAVGSEVLVGAVDPRLLA